MLNVLSFFFIQISWCRKKMIIFVSMLNFLSFFFILDAYGVRCVCYYSFDAQFSELFLYIKMNELYDKIENNVSMLNFLSFFFIAHSTTAMNKRLLRGISEKTSPCALFIHFYHYTMINKAVENCSEKILKLKIISPPLLYKYL